MIKCKCGKFTNYGITCSSCRNSYYKKSSTEETIKEVSEKEEELDPLDLLYGEYQEDED